MDVVSSLALYDRCNYLNCFLVIVQNGGIFINWAANWFVAFTFPHLLEFFQPYTFLVFVGSSFFSSCTLQ